MTTRLTREQVESSIVAYRTQLRAALKPLGFTYGTSTSYRGRDVAKKRNLSAVDCLFEGFGPSRSWSTGVTSVSFAGVCFKILKRSYARNARDGKVFRGKNGKIDIDAIVKSIVEFANWYTDEDKRKQSDERREVLNQKRAENLKSDAPGNVFVSHDAEGVHIECRDVSDAVAHAIFRLMKRSSS